MTIDEDGRVPRYVARGRAASNEFYVALITTPSGISPVSVKRQSVINNLRAIATIAIRRVRPRNQPIRSRTRCGTISTAVGFAISWLRLWSEFFVSGGEKLSPPKRRDFPIADERGLFPCILRSLVFSGWLMCIPKQSRQNLSASNVYARLRTILIGEYQIIH